MHEAHKVRNLMLSVLLVTSAGHRSDALRNMTPGEFYAGETITEEGDMVVMVAVEQHKTSKQGPAIVPIIGSRLIKLVDRYIKEIRPHLIDPTVPRYVYKRGLTMLINNEEISNDYPIMVTATGKNEDRAASAANLFKKVIIEEYEVPKEDMETLTAHAFRYQTAHWSEKHEDPNIRAYAAKALNHSRRVHDSIYLSRDKVKSSIIILDHSSNLTRANFMRTFELVSFDFLYLSNM